MYFYLIQKNARTWLPQLIATNYILQITFKLITIILRSTLLPFHISSAHWLLHREKHYPTTQHPTPQLPSRLWKPERGLRNQPQNFTAVETSLHGGCCYPNEVTQCLTTEVYSEKCAARWLCRCHEVDDTHSQAVSPPVGQLSEDCRHIPMVHQWPKFPYTHTQERLNTAWHNSCQYCFNFAQRCGG